MSNDNNPAPKASKAKASRAARAANVAGMNALKRLTGPDQLGTPDNLSATVLTQRMISATISASASAEAARAAAIVAGIEAAETHVAIRQTILTIRRTMCLVLPIVAALAGLLGVGVGLVLSHL